MIWLTKCNVNEVHSSYGSKVMLFSCLYRTWKKKPMAETWSPNSVSLVFLYEIYDLFSCLHQIKYTSLCLLGNLVAHLTHPNVVVMLKISWCPKLDWNLLDLGISAFMELCVELWPWNIYFYESIHDGHQFDFWTT